MLNRIAITGMGVVSPYGFGVPTLHQGLMSNHSAIRTVDRFDLSGYRSQVGGEIPGFSGTDANLAAKILAPAFEEALRSASLTKDSLSSKRVLSMVCVRSGSIRKSMSEPASQWLRDRTEIIADLLYPAKSQIYPISAACASLGFAIHIAQDFLTSGQFDLAILWGSEVLSRYEYSGLDSTRVLSKKGARPFDLSRDGITLGEGGGVLLLEPEKTLQDRTPLAWLAGSSTKTTLCPPTQVDTKGLASSMKEALLQARVFKPDWILAHSTGTPDGDRAECQAIESLFPQPIIPVTSNKGGTGHLLYSSGFISVASAIAGLREQCIPPTVGLENLDPTCKIRSVIQTPLRGEINSVLINSAGFYSNLSSIVLQRC